MIDPTTSRHAMVEHPACCAPCAALFASARQAEDREALAAWREQLAVHLEPPPCRRPVPARSLPTPRPSATVTVFSRRTAGDRPALIGLP